MHTGTVLLCKSQPIGYKLYKGWTHLQVCPNLLTSTVHLYTFLQSVSLEDWYHTCIYPSNMKLQAGDVSLACSRGKLTNEHIISLLLNPYWRGKNQVVVSGGLCAGVFSEQGAGSWMSSCSSLRETWYLLAPANLTCLLTEAPCLRNRH